MARATPYTIIDFAHPLDTTIVQQEHAMSSFTDAPTEVRYWDYVFDTLTETALPADKTVRLIKSVIRESAP